VQEADRGQIELCNDDIKVVSFYSSALLWQILSTGATHATCEVSDIVTFINDVYNTATCISD
jgi:hypothetical protein